MDMDFRPVLTNIRIFSFALTHLAQFFKQTHIIGHAALAPQPVIHNCFIFNENWI